jgi:hypothetical protein
MMARNQSRMEKRLRRLENLAEDIVERQKLSRLDAVIFLLYPVLLLIITRLSEVIMNYQSLTKIPTIGPLIATILPYLLVFMVGGLLFTFLLFLRAYIGDNLKGRISACSLSYAYTVIFLIYSIATQIPGLSFGLTEDGQEWFVPYLPSLFSMTLTLAAIDFVYAFQAVLSGRIAMWLKKNVPRKWKAARLSTQPVSTYKSANIKYEKITMVIACSLYAIMVGYSVSLRGLKSTSASQFGVLIGLILMTLAIVQGERVHHSLRGIWKLFRR